MLRPGRDLERNLVYSVTLPSGLVSTGPDARPAEVERLTPLPFIPRRMHTRVDHRDSAAGQRT